MFIISPSLINNVEDTRLRAYLKKKSCSEKNENELTNEWLARLIESHEIDVDSLSTFFFDELMYGKRKYMHIYNINSIRNIKREKDWLDYLSRHNISSMCCNKILETHPENSSFEIAAVNSEKHTDNTLSKIRLIYVKKIDVQEENSVSKVFTYLPVEIDLRRKMISVKVYNRRGIINENNTPKNIITSLIDHLTQGMNISLGIFKKNPSEVLYKMSKGLMDDFFNKIPNMDKLIDLDKKIDAFISEVSGREIFENKEIINISGKEYCSLNKDVIDLKSEIGFLLQQAMVFDYFFDKDIEIILDELDIILVCLRFNDKDNVTASLAGENRRKALFDSKTLMSLRRSMDLVKSLSYITICYRKEKGVMKVKYDTSDPNYLGIHILSQRYFGEEDYKRIWEIYRSYESDDVKNVRKLPSKKVS